jgi:hypothetical protein
MHRNLVLVNDPGYQSLSDLQEIGREVRAIRPEIDVHFAFNSLDNNRINRRLAEAPTLVVSFTQLKRFKPSRGRIYAGRWISKTDQIDLLIKEGVPAPQTQLITRDFRPDRGEWGNIVLVKPASPGSTFGKGVQLVRTAALRYQESQSYPEGHPGRHGPMLVQRFIDTGPLPSNYRVLTLFGVPLYARRTKRLEGEIRTDVGDEALAKMAVATAAAPPIVSEPCYDADVLELAAAASTAAPDVPLQGVDIVREASTGRLFVLELNPGGNTWHFSSVLGEPIKLRMGERLGAVGSEAQARGKAEFTAQFNAFRRAAEILAVKTLAEAD